MEINLLLNKYLKNVNSNVHLHFKMRRYLLIKEMPYI